MNVADWPKPCSLYLGVNSRKHTEIEEERRPVAGTVGEQENQREILQLVGFTRLLLDPAPQYSMLMHLGVASRVSRLGAAGRCSPMFNVDVVAC